MDMLKRHLFLIICGVVSIGSITLGVMGVKSMSKVTDELDKASRLASDLQRESSHPVNDKFIKAETKRIERVTAQHEAVLAWALERDRPEPLVPGAFPAPTVEQRLAFQKAYQPKLKELLDELHAGKMATSSDEHDAAEQISEEEKLEERFGWDAAEAGAAGSAVEREQEKPTKYPSGLLTDYGARRDAAARANIGKAHRIRCYAGLDALEVFDKITDQSDETRMGPDILEMWDAQLSLWIQRGVIAALARVNDRAAQTLEEAGESAWVGVMPIKELISIRSSGYIREPQEDEAPPERSALFDWKKAYPPESAVGVFTHSASNDLYEVVQFTLKMVVDARAIPTIVGAICKDNFNTLLQIVYEDVSDDPSNWAMDGRIYGSDPTVKVVMDFETFLFGQVYRPLMPDQIREDLGLPEREEEGD